jgi:hypothetical protein
VAKGRNTYAPWVLGRIHPLEDGCRVTLRLTLHPAAVIAVVAIFALPQYFELRNRGTVDMSWLLIFAAFHIGMYYVGFLPEARRAEGATGNIGNKVNREHG